MAIRQFPPILQERESWESYTGTTYGAFFDEIRTHFEEIQSISTYAHTRSTNTTVSNPYTQIMMHVLCYENAAQTAEPHPEIHFYQNFLRAPEDVAYVYTNNARTNGPPRLNIHHITAGSAYMNNHNYPDEMKAVSLALQRSSQHKIRVLKIDNRIEVLTNVYNWELYYKLIALLPKFFPERFPNYSNHFKNMGKALRENNREAFITAWQLWDQENPLAAQRNLRNVQRLLNTSRTRELNNLQESLSSVERTIDNYMNEIANQYRNRDTCLQRITALQLQELDNAAVEELLDYLERNTNLDDYHVLGDQGVLRLNVETPIQYIDETVLKDIFLSSPQHIREDPFRQLLQDTFIKGEYEIWTKASIDLRTIEKQVVANTSYNFPDRYKQPHLGGYNCWGNNKQYIIAALATGNLLTAIEQIVAACKNLNLLDAAVMNRFEGNIKHYPGNAAKSIKRLSDGTWISFEKYCQERKENHDTSADNERTEEQHLD